MKVLFAVSSESISDAIIKRYQKDYKEILSYKNVYYFNAILKEIQNDKTYDRIVISEDLEPFSNNNYDTIDKFIFEKLDNISDEAEDSQGKETSIILICTDRHTKGSSFLVKLFGIGVYNALLGNDRSMEQVCKLISQPRLKKEAKIYYKIDADSVNYDPTNEKEVSELEIQNILNHFKKISKNKEKYADSFNNIASQYTDDQLKIIVNCLPISVKAVLEEESPKYQELMSASMIQRVGGKARLQTKEEQEKTGIKIDILENKLSQPKMSGPIVIPSSVKTVGSKAPTAVRRVESVVGKIEQPVEKKVVKKITHNTVIQPEEKKDEDFDNLLSDIDDIDETKIDSVEARTVSNQNENNILDDDFLMTFEEEHDELEDSLLMDVDEKKNDKDELLKSLTGEFEDDLSMALDDEDIEDDISMTLDDEDIEDDLSMTLDDEDIEDDISMTLDDEDIEDDISITLDDEDIEDDLSMTLDDEDIEDDISISLDDEVNEDDLLSSFENEKNDELLSSFEDKEITSELNETRTIKRGRGRPRKNPIEIEPKPKGKRGRPRKNPIEVETKAEIENDDSLDLILDENDIEEETISFNNQDEEDDDVLSILSDDDLDENNEFDIDELDDLDDINIDDEDSLEIIDDDSLEITDEDSIELVDDEEYTEEVSLTELDDLDDLEDYQENNNDIFSGIDYEDIDEKDYLVSNISNSSNEKDDDELIMSLNDEEFDENDEDTNDILDMSFDSIEEDEDDSFLSSTIEFSDKDENLNEEPILNQKNYQSQNNQNTRIESIRPQVDYSMSTLNSLLTKDKKIVTFIGTSKNGTSFLINNLAALFSSLGINTAILDMTQNRNSYYIYTKNEEELRKIAYTSIEKLENGFAEGIRVDKNLTVYTALPNNGTNYTNAEPILSTLVQNHSLVLIDCDFNTDPSYFASCQEIYLVQSMDILTIQALTSFLRDLKAKGVLEAEKVRVVINKELKVRSLDAKMIIGGMSFYNDPAMAFMTELFNKDTVKACSIPFEDVTYSKYLDAMVNCNVSLNGYSKAFLSKLRILGDMVYPLTSRQTYSKPTQNYNKNVFSNNMNNTLNQMKNKF